MDLSTVWRVLKHHALYLAVDLAVKQHAVSVGAGVAAHGKDQVIARQLVAEPGHVPAECRELPVIDDTQPAATDARSDYALARLSGLCRCSTPSRSAPRARRPHRPAGTPTRRSGPAILDRRAGRGHDPKEPKLRSMKLGPFPTPQPDFVEQTGRTTTGLYT